MLGRVEYLKVDMKDLPKANKIVTLDKQGDDGSLHPLVHEEVTTQRQLEPMITKGLHSESDGICKI